MKLNQCNHVPISIICRTWSDTFKNIFVEMIFWWISPESSFNHFSFFIPCRIGRKKSSENKCQCSSTISKLTNRKRVNERIERKKLKKKVMNNFAWFINCSTKRGTLFDVSMSKSINGERNRSYLGFFLHLSNINSSISNVCVCARHFDLRWIMLKRFMKRTRRK